MIAAYGPPRQFIHKEWMRYIEMDIGKKTCIVCIMDKIETRKWVHVIYIGRRIYKFQAR